MLESAQTIEQAFDEANGLGTPGQNLVVADRSGRIRVILPANFTVSDFAQDVHALLTA